MSPPNPRKTPVVVVGCGVIGLTTALILQRSQKYAVTVVGRETPDDLHGPHGISQDWTSPFAGANWRPYSLDHEQQVRAAEEETYFRMRDIARITPQAGVTILPMADFGADKAEAKTTPSFLSYVQNLREINSALWPPNAAFGYAYDSLVVNVLQYLPWLAAELRKLGGVIKRAELKHIADAVRHVEGHCAVIVNCSAMGSRTLGGVMDAAMYPTRGQTILVQAPHVELTAMAPGASSDKATYVIPRADGTVIIGGVFEKNNSSREETIRTTDEVLRTCLAMCPQLLDSRIAGSSFIIKVNVGFRPSRVGGPRLEVQKMGEITVVHNYGQSSYGFQTSWGYASVAARMLDAALATKPRL
ncbi:FAD dependent oxidoreductase [Kickxella alabastrina]|uniref:FAD dependent oxidoreductase n=1 Tax=Kickxella alabastrina TaxID=61397 RepID=UPI00221FEADD|nr:FAD dependent oxidoreductase [Kickxella alabastrina]KAI7829933.1 FAD dependent oxidoreductase [Kickxella alabastrina]